MISIYYIEDDNSIAETVKQYLEGRSCRVSLFASVDAAKAALIRSTPALVLLDWNMPGDGGDNLCRWIRERWRDLPVIFLTVRKDTHDVVSGFDTGADDYVTKPFELEILYSRISALLRRSTPAAGQKLSCDKITIDQERMMVFDGENEVSLSQMEYQLLVILMTNKGKTVTRSRLLEQVWDQNGCYVNDNTLTVAMKRLREKLHQPACIKTVRSFGYRMEERV